MAENGKLSAGDRDAVAKYLERKKANPICPSCGTERWEIGAHLLEMGVYTGSATQALPRFVFPAVVLVCANCSYLRFHSAVLMGIVEPDKQEDRDRAVGAGKAEANG